MAILVKDDNGDFVPQHLSPDGTVYYKTKGNQYGGQYITQIDNLGNELFTSSNPGNMQLTGNKVVEQKKQSDNTGIKEVASLTISAIPTTAGNVSVTLNGVSTNIAVDPTTDTTTNAVATKIRNTSFSGWTTGGTGSTISFTSNTYGNKTDGTYADGGTGATGAMTTTTQGTDQKITFSKPIQFLEIYNTDSTNQGVFVVNGINITIPVNESFKSSFGGTASADVTITGSTSYILTRYE